MGHFAQLNWTERIKKWTNMPTRIRPEEAGNFGLWKTVVVVSVLTSRHRTVRPCERFARALRPATPPNICTAKSNGNQTVNVFTRWCHNPISMAVFNTACYFDQATIRNTQQSMLLTWQWTAIHASNHVYRHFLFITAFILTNSLSSQCIWRSANGAIEIGLLFVIIIIVINIISNLLLLLLLWKHSSHEIH